MAANFASGVVCGVVVAAIVGTLILSRHGGSSRGRAFLGAENNLADELQSPPRGGFIGAETRPPLPAAKPRHKQYPDLRALDKHNRLNISTKDSNETHRVIVRVRIGGISS